MLHVSQTEHQSSHFKKKSFMFFTKIFKRKSDPEVSSAGNRLNFEDSAFREMDHNFAYEAQSGLTSSNLRGFCSLRGAKARSVSGDGPVGGRVPSTLSVQAVDVDILVQPCLLSIGGSSAPSALTLTPGRTRDIDQDMEALRLSRQDNPFLQGQSFQGPTSTVRFQKDVLASRESLADCADESESDATTLMSQDGLSSSGGGLDDEDPLTLPEIHEHLIRSPPPTSWPKSPNFKVFRFPSPVLDDSDFSPDRNPMFGGRSPSRQISPRHSKSPSNEKEFSNTATFSEPTSNSHLHQTTSTSSMSTRLNAVSARLNITPRPHRRPVSDSGKDRSSNPFALLSPPLLGGRCNLHHNHHSLHHNRRSSEDSVLLVGSDGEDQGIATERSDAGTMGDYGSHSDSIEVEIEVEETRRLRGGPSPAAIQFFQRPSAKRLS
ncbi:uncharacterized protein LOC124156463 isoform X2 [Ischnura elegans]|nr:uncharacterized protein LOC124156463 isoform X2 [Ischnura elegans]XP_046386986.1 uncharacterized protein LOC124156463 isoform X2 [Ischnura elegans]